MIVKNISIFYVFKNKVTCLEKKYIISFNYVGIFPGFVHSPVNLPVLHTEHQASKDES